MTSEGDLHSDEDSSQTGTGLLDGVYVLETAGSYGGMFAGRVLADLGATVFRPQGTESTLDSDQVTRHLLDGKNVLTPDDRDLHFDFTIVDGRNDPAEYAEISDAVISVTPFGRNGPKSGYCATELILFHSSGLGYVTPRPDQSVLPTGFEGIPRPLYCAADLIGGYTGLHATAAALASLLGGLRSGRGYDVDLSQQEAALPMLRRELAVFRYTGRVACREEGGWRVAPAGIRPAKDGFMRVTIIEDTEWRSFARLIGREDWLGEQFSTADGRRQHADELKAGIDEWLATTSVEEAFVACQQAGVAMAPVWNAATLSQLPALRSSALLSAAEDKPDSLQLNNALLVNDVRVSHATGGSLATERLRPPGASLPQAGRTDALPLSGIRVLDFGHVWAGPYGAQLLAHAGAEVIKIESNRRIDVHRRMQPYAGGIADLNQAGVFNAQNSGKRSITLNLNTDRGKEIAKELIRLSDVGVQNFSVGVMDRLGLDWETIRAINPRYVYATISAFGESGPYRSYKSYGPTIESSGGLAALTGYPGGGPRSMGGGIPDTASSVYAVIGILAALIRRERTGVGAKISISQMDATVSLLPGPLLAWNSTRQLRGLIGNAHVGMAPHGVYACADPDSWVAIACENDEQWRAICAVIGGDAGQAWQQLAELRTAERIARQAELDELIEERTRKWTTTQLEQALQLRGVPITTCMSVKDLMEDEHLKQHNAFAEVTHELAGSERIYRSSWTFTSDPLRAPGPAPLMGEDNDYVYANLLGLSRAEIQTLSDEQVIY